VQLVARVEAIGREVAALGLPDFVCLQEVTPNIVTLLARQPFMWH
jgi:endonuclease/exonuclease/phosphatase family metal-dependent hydrolase